MRATVVFEDRTIIVDGVAAVIAPADFPASDPNWTALQWYGAHGTIEVRQGDRIWFEAAALLNSYLAAHAAHVAAEEAARQAALAARGAQ
jgi:hypothetical protein